MPAHAGQVCFLSRIRSGSGARGNMPLYADIPPGESKRLFRYPTDLTLKLERESSEHHDKAKRILEHWHTEWFGRFTVPIPSIRNGQSREVAWCFGCHYICSKRKVRKDQSRAYRGSQKDDSWHQESLQARWTVCYFFSKGLAKRRSTAQPPTALPSDPVHTPENSRGKVGRFLGLRTTNQLSLRKTRFQVLSGGQTYYTRIRNKAWQFFIAWS